MHDTLAECIVHDKCSVHATMNGDMSVNYYKGRGRVRSLSLRHLPNTTVVCPRTQDPSLPPPILQSPRFYVHWP